MKTSAARSSVEEEVTMDPYQEKEEQTGPWKYVKASLN